MNLISWIIVFGEAKGVGKQSVCKPVVILPRAKVNHVLHEHDYMKQQGIDIMYAVYNRIQT